jgi:hypothetical protein
MRASIQVLDYGHQEIFLAQAGDRAAILAGHKHIDL